MIAIEIIAKNLVAEGLDPIPVLDFIKQGVTKGNCALVHIKNSVFVVIYIALDEVVLHLFSIDCPIHLKSSIQEFERRIVRSSIRQIYGHADNLRLIELLKAMGYAISDSNRSGFAWMLDINTLRAH